MLGVRVVGGQAERIEPTANDVVIGSRGHVAQAERRLELREDLQAYLSKGRQLTLGEPDMTEVDQIVRKRHTRIIGRPHRRLWRINGVPGNGSEIGLQARDELIVEMLLVLDRKVQAPGPRQRHAADRGSPRTQTHFLGELLGGGTVIDR